MKTIWTNISIFVKTTLAKVARFQANVLLTLVYFIFIAPLTFLKKKSQEKYNNTSWIDFHQELLTLDQLRKQA